mmetsp:Transcript_20554/g.48545  ORF Transcript_20554/g.48545 Transcript_20554/m.48545 type:complete len:103 (-) Transcript_20554:82-390(-)
MSFVRAVLGDEVGPTNISAFLGKWRIQDNWILQGSARLSRLDVLVYNSADTGTSRSTGRPLCTPGRMWTHMETMMRNLEAGIKSPRGMPTRAGRDIGNVPTQ